jgi:hypothetical protein
MLLLLLHDAGPRAARPASGEDHTAPGCEGAAAEHGGIGPQTARRQPRQRQRQAWAVRTVGEANSKQSGEDPRTTWYLAS